MTGSAAFFDLDRTLISGTSALPVGVEAWRQGLADNKEVLSWAASAIIFMVLGDRGDASDETRAAFLSRVAGAPADALDSLGSAVLPRLVSQVRPESKKLLKMHREAGRETWIVSASPAVVVEPLAASLGMTGGLGTRGRVIEGHYTGELDGPFMYGPGKAQAIQEIAAERGYDLERCYAYSDSESDLPMMELVGHPVAVNPDGPLNAIAHERGWPVVIFARKTKRAAALSSLGVGGILLAVSSYLIGRRHGKASTVVAVASRKLRRR